MNQSESFNKESNINISLKKIPLNLDLSHVWSDRLLQGKGNVEMVEKEFVTKITHFLSDSEMK